MVKESTPSNTSLSNQPTPRPLSTEEKICTRHTLRLTRKCDPLTRTPTYMLRLERPSGNWIPVINFVTLTTSLPVFPLPTPGSLLWVKRVVNPYLSLL